MSPGPSPTPPDPSPISPVLVESLEIELFFLPLVDPIARLRLLLLCQSRLRRESNWTVILLRLPSIVRNLAVDSRDRTCSGLITFAVEVCLNSSASVPTAASGDREQLVSQILSLARAATPIQQLEQAEYCYLDVSGNENLARIVRYARLCVGTMPLYFLSSLIKLYVRSNLASVTTERRYNLYARAGGSIDQQQSDLFSTAVTTSVYRLEEDASVADAEESPDGEVVTACEVTLLPNAHLDGIWSSLLFEDPIKDQLLDYIETILLYSDKDVDPNIVSFNRYECHSRSGSSFALLKPYAESCCSMGLLARARHRCAKRSRTKLRSASLTASVLVLSSRSTLTLCFQSGFRRVENLCSRCLPR